MRSLYLLLGILLAALCCLAIAEEESCVATTCAGLNRECGLYDDGCGGVLVCGACANPLECSDEGQCVQSDAHAKRSIEEAHEAEDADLPDAWDFAREEHAKRSVEEIEQVEQAEEVVPDAWDDARAVEEEHAKRSIQEMHEAEDADLPDAWDSAREEHAKRSVEAEAEAEAIEEQEDAWASARTIEEAHLAARSVEEEDAEQVDSWDAAREQADNNKRAVEEEEEGPAPFSARAAFRARQAERAGAVRRSVPEDNLHKKNYEYEPEDLAQKEAEKEAEAEAEAESFAKRSVEEEAQAPADAWDAARKQDGNSKRDVEEAEEEGAAPYSARAAFRARQAERAGAARRSLPEDNLHKKNYEYHPEDLAQKEADAERLRRAPSSERRNLRVPPRPDLVQPESQGQENIAARHAAQPAQDAAGWQKALMYGLTAVGILTVIGASALFVQQRRRNSLAEQSSLLSMPSPQLKALSGRRSSKHTISIAPSPQLNAKQMPIPNNNQQQQQPNPKSTPKLGNSNPRLRMNSPAIQAGNKMSPKVSAASLRASQTFSL